MSLRPVSIIRTMTAFLALAASAPALAPTSASAAEAPETTVVSGPAPFSTVLTRDVTFQLASSTPGSTFRCAIDGVAVDCASGTLTLSQPAGGTYVLTARAVDPDGVADPTPVEQPFFVPYDDTRLRIVKGSWERVSAANYYRATYAAATRRTSTMTFQVSEATSLAVIVSDASTFGSFDVFLDDQLLATVSTRGTARRQRVVELGDLDGAGNETVRIVSRSDDEIRIDGLVVRTPFSVS